MLIDIRKGMVLVRLPGNSPRLMRLLPLLLILLLPSCSAGDDAKEALDSARRLAKEGKYEQALKKQVWFHNHGLDADRSYYGVRLSFALSEWIALGQKYPKALDTLKGIRDEKTKRLLAGETDRELFHDVESINEHLGDSVATVELFKRLERSQAPFAASVYDLAEEALIRAKEFPLARKYLVDPAASLGKARDRFQKGLQYASKGRNADAHRQAFESIFTDRAIQIITILNKTGSPDQALAIQSEALAVLDNPEIRNAISR